MLSAVRWRPVRRIQPFINTISQSLPGNLLQAYVFTPSLELGQILDRISAAASEVEGDSRFQWLEQRTLRLA